ncbi:MAG TPA: hypothetical protein VJX67_21455 [Blastocatellia bacterium]|nr:hypothetical protein [Blastocatellia bacterium]
MERVLKAGRVLFALAIGGLGVEHLVFSHSPQAVFPGESVIPVIPWVPGYPILAYLTGIALIAAALCIALDIRARLAAILFGILFLLCVPLLDLHRIIPRPTDVGIITVFFETLALSASALTLAGTLPPEKSYFPRGDSALATLIKSGRFLFAISSIVFGVDHFLVLGLIASLVPAWIPWHLFWAYFTGAGFIAAGICIAANLVARWAGALLGLMFLLWFLVLHAPRVMSPARIHLPAEWSSAFIALAMAGGSWIHAQRQHT